MPKKAGILLFSVALLATLTATVCAEPFRSKPVRPELYAEMERRYADIETSIKDVAEEKGIAPDKVAPADVPGRDAFVGWAISLFETLENEGVIINDDDFLVRNSQKESPKACSREGIPPIAQVITLLGRLKADNAVETLSSFLLMQRLTAYTMAYDYTEYLFPCVAALDEIGEPSVPAMLDNIKKKEHPRILEFSAQVIGMVLKEEALVYFDGEIAKETDPVVKAKLESVRPQIKGLASKARRDRLEQEEKAKAAAEAKEKELAAEVIE